MAKFKVGDRVRSIFPSTHGSLMTLIAQKRNRTDLWIVEKDGGGDGHSSEITVEHNGRLYKSYAEKYLELIQEHTPITPKVGERYRVIKQLERGQAGYAGKRTIGEIFIVEKIDGSDVPVKDKEGRWYLKEWFTTEYLELAERLKSDLVAMYDHRANMELVREFWQSQYEQPIKKSLITKTMNFIKQSLLSKEDKTLIKAGYLNEDLSLTGTGKAALEFITFTANKAALVKMAAETIKEEKE